MAARATMTMTIPILKEMLKTAPTTPGEGCRQVFFSPSLDSSVDELILLISYGKDQLGWSQVSGTLKLKQSQLINL
jgi:hypothetical protein